MAVTDGGHWWLLIQGADFCLENKQGWDGQDRDSFVPRQSSGMQTRGARIGLAQLRAWVRISALPRTGRFSLHSLPYVSSLL